jgi:hypothetical protein
MHSRPTPVRRDLLGSDGLEATTTLLLQEEPRVGRLLAARTEPTSGRADAMNQCSASAATIRSIPQTTPVPNRFLSAAEEESIGHGGKRESEEGSRRTKGAWGAAKSTRSLTTQIQGRRACADAGSCYDAAARLPLQAIVRLR